MNVYWCHIVVSLLISLIVKDSECLVFLLCIFSGKVSVHIFAYFLTQFLFLSEVLQSCFLDIELFQTQALYQIDAVHRFSLGASSLLSSRVLEEETFH